MVLLSSLDVQETPHESSFKREHNFCEQYCFQLPFSKAFVSLNPSSRLSHKVVAILMAAQSRLQLLCRWWCCCCLALCAKWCANKLWSQFLVACELSEYWSELTQKSRQMYPHSSGPIHRGLSSPLWTKSSFCRLCKSALADDILSVIFDRKLKWSYDMVREHYSLPVPALSHFTSNSHLPHTCMQTCAFHKCLCVIDDTNLSQP